MSKTSWSVVAVLVLAAAVFAGYRLGYEAGRVKPLPIPRTPEEVARAIELRGELRGILLERNAIVRGAALATRLSELGPDAAPTVAQLLRAGSVGLGAPEAALLTRFWAQYDPEAATEWALRRAEPNSIRPTVAEAAMEAWASADPAAARVMAEIYLAHAVGPTTDSIRSALVRGWSASGQPGLVEYIYDLGVTVDQGDMVAVLVSERLHRDGPDATIEFLRSLPDEDTRFKRDFSRELAPRLAQLDLQKALEWCETECDSIDATHTRAKIARQWAKDDRLAAMEWASTGLAGTERDRAVRELFDDWLYADIEGLKAWLKQFQPETAPPWFRVLVGRVAVLRAFSDPHEAYRWAALIRDDEQRELTMITITRRYREVDDAGARAWLEQSPLSEEARQKALTYPKNYKPRADLATAAAADMN
jgi:hypothetical protein